MASTMALDMINISPPYDSIIEKDFPLMICTSVFPLKFLNKDYKNSAAHDLHPSLRDEIAVTVTLEE